MKRAALIAGVSVVTLLCAGPTQVSAAWNSRILVGHVPDGLDPIAPRAERPLKPRSRPAERSPSGREQADKTPPIPSGRAAHHRLDRQAARDAVRRRRAVRKHGDFLGHAGPSDADGRVHGHPEEPPSRLQSLQRVDALHAAHHLVGLRAARRAPARLSGVARLRPPDHELRATALEDDQDGRARHRHAPRGCAAGVRARPPVRAEAEDGRGAAEPAPEPCAAAHAAEPDQPTTCRLQRRTVTTAAGRRDAANAPWR